MATQIEPSVNPGGRGSAPSPAADLQRERLKEQLGPFGYQWLCACAVYPKLRFSLSTYLGQVLALRLSRPPPDEDEHSLFPSPWSVMAGCPRICRRLIATRIGGAEQVAIDEAMLYLRCRASCGVDRGLATLEKPPALALDAPAYGTCPRDAPEATHVIRYMTAGPLSGASPARIAFRLIGRAPLPC